MSFGTDVETEVARKLLASPCHVYVKARDIKRVFSDLILCMVLIPQMCNYDLK